MRFADFICREAILAKLDAVDKEGAIREMVQALCKAGKVEKEEYESIVKAILKREELGSTGIGRGVAVPHTKHPSVDRLVGIGGRQHPGGRFRQPRRRGRASVLPADFAARPAGRSPAGAGEHLAAASRRHVLPIPQAGQERGGHPTTIERSRQQPVRIVNAAMSESKVTRTVVVTDPAGVHARTAVAIAEAVRRGKSRVTLIKDQQRVEATDVLQIMTLVAAPGRARRRSRPSGRTPPPCWTRSSRCLPASSATKPRNPHKRRCKNYKGLPSRRAWPSARRW